MTRRPRVLARGSRSFWIWAASSRVGARMRPPGRRRRARGTRSTIGIPKASVLPEPVGARPEMSRPARASRIAAAWIGQGAVLPRLTSASMRSAETPRSAKLVDTVLLVLDGTAHESFEYREVAG